MSLESKLSHLRGVLFFWEAPDRSLWFRIGTEDRRILEVPMSVLEGCAESPVDGIQQAWRIDSSNLTRDAEHGLMQVAFERDLNPVELWHINDRKWTSKEVDKLAHETRQRAKIMAYSKNGRDMALYILMAIAILIVISTLFVLATSNIDWAGTLQSITKLFGGK
jgi:hypothetical protein